MTMIKKFCVVFVLGALPALAVVLAKGGLDQLPARYRVISDGCFLSAVLLLGIGLLAWIANQGQFTSLRYVGHILKSSFSLGFARRGILSYGAFKRAYESEEKRREFSYFIFSGLIFLLLSVGFTFLFHATSHSA